MSNQPDDKDAAEVLGAFGARPERWPPERRAAVEQHLHADDTARRAWAEAARLDAALDAHAVDDGPERLDRLADGILDGIDMRDGGLRWAFAPIGWAQGLGIASVVGLLTFVLAGFDGSSAVGSAVGLRDLIVSTTPWMGSF